MTEEEIIEKISNDDVLPYIEPWALKEIVEFVIQNSKPTFPSNLDEAAEEYGRKEYSHAIHFWDEGLSKNKPEVMKEDFVDAFKAGAEWMAGQGVSVDGLFGIRGVESNNIVDTMLGGGLKMGDKVIVQIRKNNE